MKQHYISGKRLSLWMRLVKRWKLLYKQLSKSSDITKLSKLNKLSLTLGIKRKIAVGTLAMMATLGTQAQVSFEKVEFGDGQVLPNLEVSGAKPVFVDLDGDNDQDLVIGSTDNKGLRYYTNDNNEFTEQSGTNNIFNSVNIAISNGPKWVNPTFVDFDGDNDLDLVIGEGRWGKVLYFTNDGSNNFTEQTGTNNPFSSFPVENNIVLAFDDVDGDGDLDVVKGNRLGEIRYYKNTNNVFTEQTGTDFPFDLSDVGATSDPEFTDVDGDGDTDLVVGAQAGNIRYFRNDGTGNFKVDQLGTTFQKTHLVSRTAASPVFIDFDGDNDLDLVIGSNEGNLEYYENDNGSYELDNSVNDIFLQQVRVPWEASPEFVDIDGDNDLDAIIGGGNGEFNFFKNNGGVFEEQPRDSLNPFSLLDVGSSASPTFIDLDNDGDLDLVSGNLDGQFKYYEDSLGIFVERTGMDNPFSGFDVGDYSSPVFVDLDKDGDLDLVSSNYQNSSGLHYYENTAGVFTEQIGSDNPVAGLSMKARATPTFADLDKDGDLDLLVGQYYGDGAIDYFINNKDSSFTKQTGADNPFDGIDFGNYFDPTFVDLDKDGDMDLVIGNDLGQLIEYRNTSPVGFSEIIFTKKETTTVYPNPVSSQLFVEKAGAYQISNATGVVMLEGEVTSTGIDVSNLNDGFYVINVEGSVTPFMKK